MSNSPDIKTLAQAHLQRIDEKLERLHLWSQNYSKQVIQDSLNGASYDGMSVISSVMQEKVSLKMNRKWWERLAHG